jgi:hypothetical protein
MSGEERTEEDRVERTKRRGGWGVGGKGGMGRPSSQSLAFVLIILSVFHEREQSGVERKEQVEKNGDLIVPESLAFSRWMDIRPTVWNSHISQTFYSLESLSWRDLIENMSEAFDLVTNSNQKWSSDALLISGQNFMK